MRNRLYLLASLLAFAGSAGSQPMSSARQSAPLTNAGRSAVVAALARHLRADYVFPDTGKRLADAVEAKLSRGGYNSVTTADAFGDALTNDLRSVGKDAHLRVRFAPDYQAPPSSDGKPLDEKQAAMARAMVAQRAFGLSRVERLPGNVGYLDVRGFGPTEFVAEAYTGAMSLLSGTDALIIDMRQNGGGEPQSVAELISHLFAEGDVRHLNDLYSRTDNSTRAYWTNPAAVVRYTRPVYVLTSRDTFSGAEEFAYDLQTQKRATLVGESSGGGANPGDNVQLASGFIAFIPTGRAINPITKTNWEHVGVTPDIGVPATAAMKTAYVAALKRMIAHSPDPEERHGLTGVLANVENDRVQLPDYTPRH